MARLAQCLSGRHKRRARSLRVAQPSGSGGRRRRSSRSSPSNWKPVWATGDPSPPPKKKKKEKTVFVYLQLLICSFSEQPGAGAGCTRHRSDPSLTTAEHQVREDPKPSSVSEKRQTEFCRVFFPLLKNIFYSLTVSYMCTM